ncbi:hypothetical protein H5T87_01220 [bacterium]|nr:hypothetical protein [bacterium]
MKGWKYLRSVSYGGLLCSVVLLSSVLSLAQLPPPSQSTTVTITSPQNESS